MPFLCRLLVGGEREIAEAALTVLPHGPPQLVSYTDGDTGVSGFFAAHRSLESTSQTIEEQRFTRFKCNTKRALSAMSVDGRLYKANLGNRESTRGTAYTAILHFYLTHLHYGPEGLGMEAQRRLAELPYLHSQRAPAAFVRPASLC